MQEGEMILLPSHPSPLVGRLTKPEPWSVGLGTRQDTAEPPRPREPAKQGQHPGEGLLAFLIEVEVNSRTEGY